MIIYVILIRACPNKELVPHPPKFAKPPKSHSHCFYIYPAFQNAINHLLAIYRSKVMDKSLEVVSFKVCTPKRNGVVHLKVVYYRGYVYKL